MAMVHVLTENEAEARAFAACVVGGLNRNPARSLSGHCLACGQSEHSHQPLSPLGTEGSGHAWLHSRCWPAWRELPKAEAVAARATIGVQGPNARCR